MTKELGLKLEKVVELGDGISNGRLWDVRMATLKNTRVSKLAEKEPGAHTGAEVDDMFSGTAIPEPSVRTIPPMVCRPMVGELTRGGGFIGLWKRMPVRTAEQAGAD